MLKITIILTMFLAFTRSSLAGPPSSVAAAAALSEYVGDAVCGSCHQEKADPFSRTAHHLTSQPANQNSIAGKFTEGDNILRTSNPELFFRMEANERGYFQTAVMGIPPDTTSRTERFDLVIGSGGKGQTYLYWKGDELFQLPVTYWTELRQWVNSPGYRDGFADFSRRVLPRCLDCHASYFESLAPPLNRYRNTGFQLGISCEKCHGMGREHVARQTSKDAGAQLIVNPAKLSRDRQMDLCALCHAGIGDLTAAPFSYIPGKPLEKYLALPHLDPNVSIDVHGSQVELLKRSRCYQSSAAMTCSTCHNVHLPQHDLAAFSQRCLACHRAESCGVYPKLGREIASNCIDCHMPNQQTSLIVSDSNGRKVKPKVRNHWIKIYPNETWPAY
ncbi:MAG: multiheme c-type cytochrome [Terriglobales bacterium]